MLPDADSTSAAAAAAAAVPALESEPLAHAADSALSPSPAAASPERKDDRSAPVRKRLSLACTTCRQRKVKCDGARPSCRTCAKFNWPCLYQASNRKRGPRPRALPILDGNMSYSNRPYWAVSHGYYGHGFPGQMPLSPPLPPPPHFAAHSLEMPLNGAPMQVDAARHQPGAYNYDSYSTYGDFVANSGAIRIRPPPMRSPPFNPTSPTSMYMHRDTQSYHSHHHNRSYGHHPYRGSGGSDAPCPTSPLPPLSAHCAPRYMDRLPLPYAHSAQSAPETHSVAAMHRYPPRHSPMLISPLLPPGQHASEPRRITMPPTAAASTPDPVSEYALPPDAAPPPISSQAQQLHPSAGAAWPPEALVHPQALAAPALRSTPPQHMRQSAQFHASASPYAPEMRPSAAVAPSHPPAIYASAKADTPPADASGFQTQPTAAPDARQQLHLHPQSPSSPPLKQLHSSEYDRQHLRSREQPAPYDANPYVPPRHAPERALSAGTLPFSDGVARPRLPPLSEILGKDYQLVLSPSAGPHPHLDSHSSAGMPDRYPLPVAQHKDSFRNEVSKMLAHESLH